MLKLITITMVLIFMNMFTYMFIINSTINISIMIMNLMLFLLYMSFNSLISNWMFMDMLSISLILLTIWISMLMMLSSLHSKNMKMFMYTIMSLMILLMVMFLMNNYLLFYFFFEMSLVPTLFLILSWGYQPERIQAGSYLMMYTITASLPLLLGIISLFMFSQSLYMFNMMLMIENNFFMNLWWFSMTMAFLVKFPIFMSHLWLPKAHVEAPLAGSMILAGILLKLGGYGYMRINSSIWWFSSSSNLFSMVTSLSIWGAVITGMICIRQTDMKSLIAYSSIGHMGLIISSLMTSKYWGWNGALAMMIAHGLCSSALFTIANMSYKSTNSRSIIINKGLLTLFPSMSMWWFILTCSNMAAPPSLNMISEIILLTTIMSLSMMMMFPLFLSIIIVGGYSLILYSSTQHGQPSAYMNTLNMFNPLNHLILFLHITPLMILPLKMDFIMPLMY